MQHSNDTMKVEDIENKQLAISQVKPNNNRNRLEDATDEDKCSALNAVKKFLMIWQLLLRLIWLFFICMFSERSCCWQLHVFAVINSTISTISESKGHFANADSFKYRICHVP